MPALAENSVFVVPSALLLYFMLDNLKTVLANQAGQGQNKIWFLDLVVHSTHNFFALVLLYHGHLL